MVDTSKIPTRRIEGLELSDLIKDIDEILDAKANKDEVYSKSDSDSKFVKLSGNEIINGVKTFNDSIVSKDGIELHPQSNQTNHGGYIDFHYNQSSEDYTSRIIDLEDGLVITNDKDITLTSQNVYAPTPNASTSKTDNHVVTVAFLNDETKSTNIVHQSEIEDLKKNAIPNQEGHENQFLKTNGSTLSWDYTTKIVNDSEQEEKGLGQLVIHHLTQDEYNVLVEEDEINDDELYITDGEIKGVTEEEVSEMISQSLVNDKQNFSDVAFSGDYEDLNNTPEIDIKISNALNTFFDSKFKIVDEKPTNPEDGVFYFVTEKE